jgi:hypothetical protein
MLKRRALMKSTPSKPHDFLKKIGKNLSVPDKKFPCDSTIGLFRRTLHRTSQQMLNLTVQNLITYLGNPG